MATTTSSNSNIPINNTLSTKQNKERLYTPYRSIGIEFGFIMMMTAILGVFTPHFLGLNLTFMHSLVLGVAGALSVYSGIDKNPLTAYRINFGLGIFFLLNAVIGYLVGDPGVPRFDFYTPAQLDSIAPGFLDLATTDHIVHGLLALVFFVEALTWKFHITPSTKFSFIHGHGFKIGKRVFIFALIATILLSVVYALRA